jgi:nucleoside-diphosphate-sugar epimerase
VKEGRCLVTGADGFIGSALVRRLEEEYGEVWRLVRPGSPSASNPRTLTADLSTDTPALAPIAPLDSIFHLAGRAHAPDRGAGEDALQERANVDATRNLLAAAAHCGARRVVFTSSMAAMGAGAEECLDETAPPAPVTAYGRTKRRAEELVLAPSAAGRPDGVVLRLPLVYGPGQKGNLDRMLRAIVLRRFPPPPRVHNRRSVVHVDDVVDALLLAARHPAATGRVYLVCESEPCATRGIYEGACAALGRRPAAWGVPAAGLRAFGWLGDLAALALGRRVGFDSIAIEKLLGSASYSPALVERELGFRTRRRFHEELPRLVAALGSRTTSAEGAD